VWRRHPADRVQTAFRVRNHPWPSHSWQPPVAADFLSASRGRSGKSSRILANRSSHHRCRPLVARPPTGASSCRSMTSATSFKPRPTNCPRSIVTASDRRRTRGVEAPGTADWDTVRAAVRKMPPQGGRVALREPAPVGRNVRSRCSRVVRQPGDRCGSAIDRAILTTSRPGPLPWGAWLHSTPTGQHRRSS
jgi:hypothetical protein